MSEYSNRTNTQINTISSQLLTFLQVISCNMRLKEKTTGIFVLHRVHVENVHLMKCRINIVY